MEIRTLRKSDACTAAKIWQDIFEESDSFVQWLFTSRFYPEYSACAEDQGQIVSVIHGMPLPLRFQDRIYTGAMLCGVATLPSHRGLGLMKQLMAYEIQLLKERGVQLLTHTPVDPAIYYSCDQFPCARTGEFIYERKGGCTPGLQEFDPDRAFAAYQHFAIPYSGIVWRDKALMKLKADDYLSDQIRPYMLESGAYCFADIDGDGIATCQELAYFQESEVQQLLEAIPARSVTGRLPADFANTRIFQKWHTRKHAVLYPLDPEITADMPKELSPGRQMELLCEGLNCFIWETY